MILGLDTSVIVRLLVGEPAAQASAARARLAGAVDSGEPVIVTDLAVAESYHALHFHYGVPKAEARDLLVRLLESGVVSPDRPFIAADLMGEGAGVVDRLIHGRHQARGALTLTFDRRQAALPGAVAC